MGWGRTRKLIGVAAIACAALPASASAGELDQDQPVFAPLPALPAAIDQGQTIAQTFTAGLTGDLDKAELPLGRTATSAGDLVIQIRNTVAGVPGDQILASAALGPGSIGAVIPSVTFTPVPFSPPAAVSAGTQYAIVASANVFSVDGYAWGDGPAGPYAAGAELYSPPAWTVLPGDYDAAFRTFVVRPPGAAPPVVQPTPTPPRAKPKKCKKKKKHKAKASKKKCRRKSPKS